MDKTKQFGADDRVRIDIPDEQDPDFTTYHGAQTPLLPKRHGP